MGVHSMGAPLMLQICPLFSLRLQTANDYLALGGLVILQYTCEIRELQDKQVWHLQYLACNLSPILQKLCLDIEQPYFYEYLF